MLELILPAGVDSEERFGEATSEILLPEEVKIIAHAVDARRREYATVRSCARACLGRLGYEPVPILPGLGGAPSWPAGVLGSMTHCAGRRHRRRARRTAARRRPGPYRHTCRTGSPHRDPAGD
jgi:4'-phosphopantetheinyl transferase EntD